MERADPKPEPKSGDLPKVDIPPAEATPGLPPRHETIPPFLRREDKAERPQGARWLLAEAGQVFSEFIDFCGVVLQWAGSWLAALWTPLGWPLHPLGKLIREWAAGLGAQASAFSPDVNKKAAQKEAKSKEEKSVQENIIANNLLQRGVAVALVLFLLAYVLGLVDSGRDGAESIRLARLVQREQLMNDFANNGARSSREMQHIVRDGVEVQKLKADLAKYAATPSEGDSIESRNKWNDLYRHKYELWSKSSDRWDAKLAAWRTLPNYTGMAALIRARFISADVLEGVDTVQSTGRDRYPAIFVSSQSHIDSTLRTNSRANPESGSRVAPGRDVQNEQQRLLLLLNHYESIFDRLTELSVSVSDARDTKPHRSLRSAIEAVEQLCRDLPQNGLRSENRVRPWISHMEDLINVVRAAKCAKCDQDHSILECMGTDCQVSVLYSASDACATSLEVIYVEIIAIIGTMLDEQEPLRTPIQRWIVDPFIRWVGA
jgi:hypothetical protein